VRAQAFEGEHEAAELEIFGGPESAEIPVEDLRMDAFGIHVLESHLRLEARTRNVVVSPSMVGGEPSNPAIVTAAGL